MTGNNLISKRLQQSIKALMLIVAMALPVMAQAHDFEDSNGLCYNLNTVQGTATVTYSDNAYGTYSGNVSIPREINVGGKLYAVTEVGDNAFRNCHNLASVNLGAMVQRVGKRAFLGCDKLTELLVTQAVTVIDDRAFADCSALSSVTFNNASPLELGVNAFLRCTALKNVEWARALQLTGGGEISSVGNRAFEGCSALENITLPHVFDEMGSDIFASCTALKVVTLSQAVPLTLRADPLGAGSKVTIRVPRGARAGTSLDAYRAARYWNDYNIEELPYSFVDADGYQYTDLATGQGVALTGHTATAVVVRPSITAGGNTFNVIMVPARLFAGSSITGFDSSHNPYLKLIEDGAFMNCTSLKAVALNEGLTELGDGVMEGCTALQSITIPSTLHVVPERTFAGCTALQQVQLRHGVISIKKDAFLNCTALERIFLPRSVAQVETHAFRGSSRLQHIDVDTLNAHYRSVEGVLVELNYGETFLEEELGLMGKVILYPPSKREASFFVPTGIVEIAPYAFSNATNLKQLTIPSSITTMGTDCFNNMQLEVLNNRAITPCADSLGVLAPLCRARTGLQVPLNAVTAYQEIEGWKDFYSITERYDIYSDDNFAYDWGIDDQVILVGVKPAAIKGGALTLPKQLQLSKVTYDITGLMGSSTANVQTAVKSLNINNVLNYIDMSDGINPISAITSLENITLDATNEFFALDDGILYSAARNKLYYYLRSKPSTEFTLAAAVDTIMTGAFMGNNRLQRVTARPSLKDVGTSAFEGCTALQLATGFTGVASIGDKAWRHCAALATFEGGEELMSVGEAAFEGCTNLRQIPLAHGMVQSIGNNAFKDCASLRKVVLSNTLKSLGDNAFDGCISLNDVYFNAELVTMGNDVFNRCRNLSSVWLCNATPPAVTPGDINRGAIALYVPEQAVPDYRANPLWNSFASINATYCIDNGADVNDDKAVNVLDVTLTYSVIMGLSDVELKGHFDVNRDGIINSADITLIYNYILNGTEVSSTYKFVNQQNMVVTQSIAMSDAPQVIKAIDPATEDFVRNGVTADVDNTTVVSPTMITHGGASAVQLAALKPGYASLVMKVTAGGTCYYRSYPLKVSQ